MLNVEMNEILFSAERQFSEFNCAENVDHIDQAEEHQYEQLESIREDFYFVGIHEQSVNLEELSALVLDVSAVVSKLPTELRGLCVRLQSASLEEISQETGVSLETICNSIEEIRSIFEDAGLRDYL